MKKKLISLFIILISCFTFVAWGNSNDKYTDEDEYPNPLMAGAGNKVGGIHINRTSHYKVEYAQRNNCHYVDNLEYFSTIDATREMYKKYGITVI